MYSQVARNEDNELRDSSPTPYDRTYSNAQGTQDTDLGSENSTFNAQMYANVPTEDVDLRNANPTSGSQENSTLPGNDRFGSRNDSSISLPQKTYAEVRRDDEIDMEDGTVDTGQPHPRAGMATWRWKATVGVMLCVGVINGYDVSNVANIQSRLYEALGDIELLPWIGLSYSLANFAFLSFARKIAFCFQMRWILITHIVVFIVGSAVAGAASELSTVIVGRVIMGWGGSVVQQSIYTLLAVLATPAESPVIFALISASWAVGLAIGGPIGSAFAENQAATWRWAFYINIPFLVVCLVLAALCVPSVSLAPQIPLRQRLVRVDPLGVMFNMAAPVLFAVATTFSGNVWEWGSGASTAVWVVFGFVLVSWIAQQQFCILTTPEQRAFPMHMLSRLDLVPIWIASGCSGAAYATTLYYTPLFFSFARGHGPLEQTERILPFVLVFIVAVLTTGILLPRIGVYKIVYMLAGTITLSSGIGMAKTMDVKTSEAQVMGLEALIAIGLGMHFQHGLGISNAMNKDPGQRVDSAVVCNMFQMGGIAVTLSIAGCIFQNVGFNLLSGALPEDKFTDGQIREALAGETSTVWEKATLAEKQRGIQAVTEAISREFYIVVAVGAVCLVCGLLMRWEKLDYGKGKKESERDTV